MNAFYIFIDFRLTVIDTNVSAGNYCQSCFEKQALPSNIIHMLTTVQEKNYLSPKVFYVFLSQWCTNAVEKNKTRKKVKLPEAFVV